MPCFRVPPHSTVCPRHDDWSCAGGPPKLMGDELPGLRGNLICGARQTESRHQTAAASRLRRQPRDTTEAPCSAWCLLKEPYGFSFLFFRCSGLVPVRAAISTRPSDVGMLGRWTDGHEACARLRHGVTVRDLCSPESQIAASVDRTCVYCMVTLRRPSGLWAKWPKPEVEDFVPKLDFRNAFRFSFQKQVQDVHTSLPPLFHDGSGSPWDSHASDVCRDRWFGVIVRYGGKLGVQGVERTAK